MKKRNKNSSVDKAPPEPRQQKRTRTRQKRSGAEDQPTTSTNKTDKPIADGFHSHRKVLHDGDGIPLLEPESSDGAHSHQSAGADGNDQVDGRPGDKVGYKNPPRKHRFKAGESGNPSGARKRPKLPKHLGNQADAIAIAYFAEINKIMMHGLPEAAPALPYIGAKMWARMIFRDAMTKDGGYARKMLFSLYYDDKRHLDQFKPKDRNELEMDLIRDQLKLITDPRTTDADVTRSIKRWEEDLDF